MFCVKCGKELEEHAKFCSNCGQKIENDNIKDELKQETKSETTIENNIKEPLGNNQARKRFWEKTWFTWLMLFFVPPVGIALLWKNNTHNILIRLFISILFSMAFIDAYIERGFISGLERIVLKQDINTSTNYKKPIDISYEKPTAASYEKVDIVDLEKQLDANAARAQQNWQGRYVELSGKLSTIDADGDNFSLEGITFLSKVHCNIMNDKQKRVLIGKNRGDIVVVKGRIKRVGELTGYSIDIGEMK